MDVIDALFLAMSAIKFIWIFCVGVGDAGGLGDPGTVGDVGGGVGGDVGGVCVGGGADGGVLVVFSWYFWEIEGWCWAEIDDES